MSNEIETGPDDRPEFRSVLRGYEREQVDEYIAGLSARIDELEKERAALAARLGGGGDRGISDLGTEIDAVANEIGRILHTAHEAAEGMRSRASEDAEQWRTEADADTRALRQSAQADAEMVRGDAWETGSELLAQAHAYAARLEREAEQEALAIRADAEREASRYVAAARRSLEEEARQARLEANATVERARLEAERLTEAANREAEAAQERARALEERRAELMSELDTAQEAISKLESDLEERKESLRAAGVSETKTVRVLPTDEEPEGWFDADETVRLVGSDVLEEPEPVDAEAMVAEVMRLRKKEKEAARVPTEPPPPEKPGPAPAPEAAPAPEPAPAPAPEPPPAEVEAAAAPPSEPEPAPEAVEAEPEAREEPPAPAAEEPEPPAPVPEPGPDAELGEIDALFSSLRREDRAPAPESEGAEPGSTRTAVSAPPPAAVDPFDLRDRLLLPVGNRLLRDLKRDLVELQNVVLEELRTHRGGWHPDRDEFSAALGDHLRELAGESLEAGYAAAAELTGASSPPRPADVHPEDPSAEFVGSLWREVEEVADRAEQSGAATRQTAAAVSKVFRTWRTDGAERRLRAASFASYHEGVLWGLAELGVEGVRGIADGRTCAECPAVSGASWAPTGLLPEGTGLPPVHVDCACTVIPAQP